MRPLLTLILGLTGVMAFPGLSVGQFSPLVHEVLSGFMEANVISGAKVILVSNPPQITLGLTIDSEGGPDFGPAVSGSLHCRTRGTPACIGKHAVLSNVVVSLRENSPREAGFKSFDADVTFVQEGVSCHFMGVTPPVGELEVISGSYTCANTSGSVVETGTFGAIRRCR